MIAVVDYHKGNLKSVERGLCAAGGSVCVTDDANMIARASAIVLPGVGAFADAAATMDKLGQADAIRERVGAGVPFLGICLGLHLMFEEGTEGAHAAQGVRGEQGAAAAYGAQGAAAEQGAAGAASARLGQGAGDPGAAPCARGLGFLPGIVDKMPSESAAGKPFKVPHVGWNSVLPATGDTFDCPLFAGVEPGEFFYFTHSYIAPASGASVAVTEHSVVFPSAVCFGDAAFGVQFHPEKSSSAGARVLRNFVDIAKGA